MAEPVNDAQADLVRLRKLAGKKEFDKLEAAWMEAVPRPGADVQGLLSVLETLGRRDGSGLTDSLFWFMLSELAERLGSEAGVRMVRQAAPFLTGSPALREEAAAAYQRAYAAIPEIRAMAEMTVLNPVAPFGAAIARLDKLLKLRPGTCVIDTQHEKLGQVTRIDAEKKLLEVAYADRPRTYDRLGIDKLEPLAPDDFRSKIASDRPGMEALAREKPTELIKVVLRTYGPRVEFRDLKEHLKEIIPTTGWSKWWNQAKVLVKRDPMLEMGDGTQPWLFLRTRAVAYEDELKAAFDAAPSAEEKLVTVLGYLAECVDKAPDAALAQHFGRHLAESVEKWRESSPAMAVGALAMIAELHNRIADIPAPDSKVLEPLLFERGDPGTFMRPVANDRLARAMLEFVRASLHSSWHEVWAAILPGCSPAVCEFAAQALQETGHAKELGEAVGVILARPHRHPSALAWLWKAVCSGDYAEATKSTSRIEVAIRLLTAAGALMRDATFDKDQQQTVLTQLRNAISAKNFDAMLTALRESDAEGASRAFHAVERNFILGEHMRLKVLEIITQTHPKLFFQHVQPWEEADILYSTPTGFKKYQEEFAILCNIKMAANAKAIGDAAAHGDLSENAEFTAALEERNLLTEKAARMEGELKKVRVITPAMTQGDHVNIGSTIEVRNLASGQTETMTFLGPWDGDPDKGIYSYRAALALTFMGKKVGDRAEFKGEEATRSWEILAIRGADLGPA